MMMTFQVWASWMEMKMTMMPLMQVFWMLSNQNDKNKLSRVEKTIVEVESEWNGRGKGCAILKCCRAIGLTLPCFFLGDSGSWTVENGGVECLNLEAI